MASYPCIGITNRANSHIIPQTIFIKINICKEGQINWVVNYAKSGHQNSSALQAQAKGSTLDGSEETNAVVLTQKVPT